MQKHKQRQLVLGGLAVTLSGLIALGPGYTQGFTSPNLPQQAALEHTVPAPEAQPAIATAEMRSYGLWDRFKRYRYGRNPQNVLYLYIPPTATAERPAQLALLVHGGNFLFGSARDYSMIPLASYFLQRGYAVASVDYRTLQEHPWPTPVDDVRQGITKALTLAGNRVKDATYVGYSAGAVTGALLLYSGQFQNPPGITRFIGISGLYDKAATSEDPIDVIRMQSLQRINLLGAVDSIRNAKTRTPALLIEGAQDYFADNYPHTARSHASRLALLLQTHHTPAYTYWATTPGYNGHEGPIALLALGDENLISALDHFLQSVH